MTINIVDIIIKKRNGIKLTKEEIIFFVEGTVSGTIPDYQASAMLMAIYFSSLDAEETAALTLAMANSGDRFCLNQIPGIKVDKHSTGGVADTTTLILAPLVASLGVPVIKMSGRGLGFSGGTLDKLESIPGFHCEITEADALHYAQKSGIVLMSQTENLTPADKKLYALRDVTGTVESLPLIASSIMSKKIAAGADAVVLDVKCGSGAFMKDLDSAKVLALQMASIGQAVGMQVRAVISSMAQPLGSHIGNALEVKEAIEALKGNITGDLLEVSLTLGAHMLMLGNKTRDFTEAKNLLLEAIQNGKGLEKLRELIIQQKGNPNIIENTALLPQSQSKTIIKASSKGFITFMNTEKIGKASLETGAGRVSKLDSIDYGAGIILKKRLGDFIEKGEELAEIYASNSLKCQNAAKLIVDAIKISEEYLPLPELILETI